MEKRVATVCFIINDNKVLLALIEYSPSDKKWNGIGGFVNENETPEEAVVREISEETFIQVKKEDLIKFKELNLDIHLIIYKTHKWSGELKTKEPSLKQLEWFDKNEIPLDLMHAGSEEWILDIFN